MRINLADEALKEGGPRRRGRLSRIMPGMHRVGADASAQ